MSGQYEEFASQYLSVAKQSGDEWMVLCCYHDESNPSMRFNVATGQHICYSCGEGGGIRKIARHFGVARIEDVTPALRDVMKMLDELKRDVDTRHKPPRILPESHLKRYDIPTNYWIERGFTQTIIDAFDLGYDPMADAVTIPLRDMNGDLLGVTKRYLGEDVADRYKYPAKFERSLNLFASWFVEQGHEDTVAMVEGSVDCMKVWQAGVPSMAQYGSSISLAQIRLLRRLGVRRVILFFDDDKAGHKATTRALGTLTYTTKRNGKKIMRSKYVPDYDLRREFLVTRVFYPYDFPNDPGAMSSKQIVQCVDKSEECLTGRFI